MRFSVLLLLSLVLLPGLESARAEKVFVCAGSSVETGGRAAAKPARSGTEGTRRALALFARFRGEERGWQGVPEWSGGLFDPERPGSFSHFYDAMSFGKLQVRGKVASRVYESEREVGAYLAEERTEIGDFGSFCLELLRQADGDIDFARFDDDGPDGIPNSGDDDGVVDALFILLASAPTNFLLGSATGFGSLGFEGDFRTDDPGISGKSIRISADQGTIQQGRNFAEGVGSMCHEYGHVLGLPDLYDTEFLSRQGAGPEEDSAGIGVWGLMGWGATGWSGGNGPNSFCAWSRARLGWSEVAEVNDVVEEVRLQSVGEGGRICQVPLALDEYFLLEYRSRDSFYDRHIPGEGLLVWHVDRKTGRDVVDLECADGRFLDAGFPLGENPDSRRGGDNLDFWAHDADYARLHAGNLGDGTDPFDGVSFREFSPETNPDSFDRKGEQSVRLAEMQREGESFALRVELPPLLASTRGVRVVDANQDGLGSPGEEVEVHFALVNRVARPLRDVSVVLVGGSGLVEVLQGEWTLENLLPDESAYGTLRFRFASDFEGMLEVELGLEIFAGGERVGGDDFSMLGVSRQVVESLTVIDSLGNGDGAVQAGEYFRLEVKLEGMDAEGLDYFRFFLRSLDAEVTRFGSEQLLMAPEGKSFRWARTPEFLVAPRVAPGTVLRFEWEGIGPMISWRDTLSLEVAEGRIEGLVSRLEGLDFPADFAPIAVADYDNDGWPDLMGADRSVSPARPLLLHNEGDGSFRKGEGVLPEIRFREGSSLLGGCAFGDFDGDGDADLFVPGGIGNEWSSREGVLLRNDGGRFVEVEGGFEGDPIVPAQIAVWWDFDGDGILDLQVGGSYGNRFPNRLYRGDGRGRFTEFRGMGALPGSSEPVNVLPAGMAVADFDGDGWQDLYLPVTKGANRLFLGDGGGGFLDATTGDIADPGRALGVTVGDIDNDGDLDIFQPAGGIGGPIGEGDRSLMLLNMGEGQFLDVTEAVGFGGRLELSFACLVDIDNDGDLDLLGSSPPRLFLNSGEGIFVDRTFQADLPGMRTLADFDGDGFIDVCDDGGMFRNRGNDNHFLRVELVGTQSNRDGIGARLIARAGDLVQMRELSPGDGWFQDERVAHFGLGRRDRVDELEVRWPSGRVDRLRDIPVDGQISVTEGRGEGHVIRRTAVLEEYVVAIPCGFALEQNVPNPFNGETAIRFALQMREEIELAVFNLVGQKVATLVEGMREAGEYTVRWDGLDGDGKELATGLFLYQLRVGERMERRKLILLR